MVAGEGTVHVPGAVHVLARVSVLPLMHDAALQTVPTGKTAHELAPLHVPVVPHVEAACAAHSLSGSAPLAMGPHVPFASPVRAMLQP